MGQEPDIAGEFLARRLEAETAEAEAQFAIFDISGRHYIAVPARLCERGANIPNKDEKPAVGRITIGGELHFLFGRTKLDDEPAPAEVLTRRELQVAMLVADGKGDKQIARMLGISSYTVREHLRRTFSKLHVPNRSALVALVVRQDTSLRPGIGARFGS